MLMRNLVRGEFLGLPVLHWIGKYVETFGMEPEENEVWGGNRADRSHGCVGRGETFWEWGEHVTCVPCNDIMQK